MYSISNAASRAATPMQLGGGDQLVMLTGKYIVLQKVTIFLRKNYIRGSFTTFVVFPWDPRSPGNPIKRATSPTRLWDTTNTSPSCNISNLESLRKVAEISRSAIALCILCTVLKASLF